MMITDQQVKLLMRKLKKNTQEVAATKSGMTVKTARKYIKSRELPSEMKSTHNWPTREDPFSDEWKLIQSMLETSPGLQAKTLINHLIKLYPGKYKSGQVRTLQRRIRDWRALCGNSKEIIFRQHIQPGKQSQSDYTCMNSLNITLEGQPFKHLLFHFMLPYSRWESVELCFSESFETLTHGFEKAVWELGYVAPEHRTDNLTAATQAMGSHREFTDRWKQFMAHYHIIPTTNNKGVSHENGSVEKSHDTLKNDINQMLLIRGYRDFPSQKDYFNFIEDIVKRRNESYLERFADETPLLKELPEKKWNAPSIYRTRVSPSSIIQIYNHPYTVPSRLINYTLKVYVYHDEIILFYGTKQVQRMPRVYSDPLAGIDYRHIIDGLVRKPSAFANYHYHEALFPRLCFRKAYDFLRAKSPSHADKHYLKILQLAKIQSEQSVADALELLLEERIVPTPTVLKEWIDVYHHERSQVTVNQPNLADYDCLLKGSYTDEKGLHS